MPDKTTPQLERALTLRLFICFIVHCYRRLRESDERLLVPGGATGALITGLCGLAITLFAMAVAMIPPPGVSNIWIHEAKVGGKN